MEGRCGTMSAAKNVLSVLVGLKRCDVGRCLLARSCAVAGAEVMTRDKIVKEQAEAEFAMLVS